MSLQLDDPFRRNFIFYLNSWKAVGWSNRYNTRTIPNLFSFKMSIYFECNFVCIIFWFNNSVCTFYPHLFSRRKKWNIVYCNTIKKVSSLQIYNIQKFPKLGIAMVLMIPDFWGSSVVSKCFNNYVRINKNNIYMDVE